MHNTTRDTIDMVLTVDWARLYKTIPALIPMMTPINPATREKCSKESYVYFFSLIQIGLPVIIMTKEINTTIPAPTQTKTL